MELNYIEFDDADDINSKNHPSKKENKSIRFTIALEAYILLLPNAKSLGKEDQDMFSKLLRLAYYQGKRVGIEKEALADVVIASD